MSIMALAYGSFQFRKYGHLRAIQSVSADLSWSAKLAFISGLQPPPEHMMIDAIRAIPSILPKRKAPRRVCFGTFARDGSRSYE
jgi:hypothetical protein